MHHPSTTIRSRSTYATISETISSWNKRVIVAAKEEAKHRWERISSHITVQNVQAKLDCWYPKRLARIKHWEVPFQICLVSMSGDEQLEDYWKKFCLGLDELEFEGEWHSLASRFYNAARVTCEIRLNRTFNYKDPYSDAVKKRGRQELTEDKRRVWGEIPKTSGSSRVAPWSGGTLDHSGSPCTGRQIGSWSETPCPPKSRKSHCIESIITQHGLRKLEINHCLSQLNHIKHMHACAQQTWTQHMELSGQTSKPSNSFKTPLNFRMNSNEITRWYRTSRWSINFEAVIWVHPKV